MRSRLNPDLAERTAWLDFLLALALLLAGATIFLLLGMAVATAPPATPAYVEPGHRQSAPAYESDDSNAL